MRQSARNNRKKVLHTFHQALERDNALTRCCAVNALERLNACDDESIKRLIALLLDPDPDVRMDVAAALGRMQVAQATEALLNNLEHDPEGDVRIQAVIALGNIRSKQAVEPLIRCLSEDGYPHLDNPADEMEYCASWEVLSQCLSALGEIGDPRATEQVIALLQNDDYEDLQETGFRVLAQLNTAEVRIFLLKQLKEGGRLARRRAAQALTRLPECQGGSQDLPADILEGLTQALMDPDPSVRIHAARALGGTRNPLVAVPLTLLLSDPDPEVRQAVAVILGTIRGGEVVDRLHTLLLNEPDSKLQRRIVQVLGEIGDPASRETLSELLDTEDSDLRYEVVGALGAIGAPGPEQQIARILTDQSTDPNLRIQAAGALGALLKKATAEARAITTKKKTKSNTRPPTENEINPKAVLEQAVYDPNEQVSYAALSVLMEMNPKQATNRLTDLLCQDKPVEEKTAHEKIDEGDAQANKIISEALKDMVGDDPGASTLASIVAEAGQQMPAASEPSGHTSQSTPQQTVRIFAARLLGGISKPGVKAVKTLIAACDASNTELHREALLALGRIGDKTALPAVMKGLTAPQPEIRLTALDALGRIKGNGIPDNDVELVKLLHDPDPHIRQLAVRALASRKGPTTADYLSQALRDEHPEVCRAALAALSKVSYRKRFADQIVDVMFQFSGDLRAEAGATMRRLEDFTVASRLLGMLDEPDQEELHWICIDALGEMYAQEPIRVS